MVGGRTRCAGAEALRARAGSTPVALRPEGRAGAHQRHAAVDRACSALALAGAERLARAADIAAALSIDGLRGSTQPFDARIHDARPFAGQRASAANLARLLAGSAHQRVARELRPGAGRVLDALRRRRCTARRATRSRSCAGPSTIEANAATDNPMVFADTGEIVSGGNFHGAPVARRRRPARDRASRSWRRSASGGPIGWSIRRSAACRRSSRAHGGLQSGLMMAQVTAAALTSELKTLAHPAGVDTIPTSGNKEDHVSMSMARRAQGRARRRARARTCIAIEMLCACQAIDLLAPLTTSAPLARVHDTIRAQRADARRDRPPSPDIAAIDALIATGALDHARGVDVN